ncbi:MAG: hypothetical protein PGN13_06480 [Patulibacter minatonensis]
MPQNLATGKDAEHIADFLAHYAGKKAKVPAAPSAVDTAEAETTPEAGSTTPDSTTPAGAADSNTEVDATP